MGVATPIELTDDERETLATWVRRTTTEQRLVQRARIVLEAAAGKTTKEVAALLQVRPATVSRWRTRFAQHRIAGLADAPRSGKPAKYDKTTERRILSQLDQPPPEGYTVWTGGLVAKALGDVSALHVWRVLRRHGIHLQRRRRWCVGTDPQFAQKAADIVGLYLDPPENAVVISVDEKPAIQALERAQGWLRLAYSIHQISSASTDDRLCFSNCTLDLRSISKQCVCVCGAGLICQIDKSIHSTACNPQSVSCIKGKGSGEEHPWIVKGSWFPRRLSDGEGTFFRDEHVRYLEVLAASTAHPHHGPGVVNGRSFLGNQKRTSLWKSR